MPSAEDYDNLFKHVHEWRRLLETDRPQSNDVVWHYTNGDGLIGIISSGTIFATQASCLNDTTEIRYASKLLKKALDSRLESVNQASPSYQYLKAFSEVLEDTDDLPGHAGSHNFIACFSRLKDDLSQWRAYGGGENGYAIGVRVCNLLGNTNTLIDPVNYDADIHAHIASEVADRTVRFMEADYEESTEEWKKDFLLQWGISLSSIAAFTKHPAFKSEQEFRLTHAFGSDDWAQLVIRQKATLLARHLPLSFVSGGSLGERHLFPVEEIMIGPTRHKSISAISATALLVRYGYASTIKVTTSNIPFQAV